MSGMLRRLRSDETGSILPLAIFFMFLGIVLVIAVTAATSLYLERKRLFTLADGAALAGAEAFELSAVKPADGRLRAELDSAMVRAAAADYLASAPHGAFEELALEQADAPDGRSAHVRLAATWHPPVVSLLLPDGIRIDVDSSARSVFR